MKKSLFGCFGCLGIIVLIVIVIAILAAVFGSGDSENNSKSKQASVGETVKVDKLEYTVNEVTTADSVGAQYSSSNADGQYLVVDVTVKNNGDKDITVDSELFKLINGKKTASADSSASTNANATDDPSDLGFFLEQLNPDSEKTGKIVFDVSENTAQSDKLKLQVASGFFGNEKANIKLK